MPPPHAMVCVDVVNLKLPRPLAIHVPPSGLRAAFGAMAAISGDACVHRDISVLASGTPTSGMEQQLRGQIEKYITALGGRIVDENSWR